MEVVSNKLALPVMLLMGKSESVIPITDKDLTMSRFQKASHVLWCCQYHIVWTPKYRFRILRNNVGKEVYKQIRISSEQLGIEVVELNVQIDHVHLLVKVPPRLSISHVIGHLKGKTALRLFSKFPYLRKNKLWGESFLGKRLLCRHRRYKRRNDKKVREVSGKT
ncbi:IS1004 transposase [Klebsiella michiganensis]|nr:IS1004 transposase [Klebsiella michiganensis]